MSLKSCGSCKFFIKLKTEGKGICTVFDSSGSSQLSAEDCEFFKNKPFVRKQKKTTRFYIEESNF